MSVAEHDWMDGADRAIARSGWKSYEDAAVRAVLKRLDLDELAAPLAREARARTGRDGCTFDVFDEVLDFPVRFGVGYRLVALTHLAIPDLFDRFSRTPPVKALAALADDLGDRKPLALVFNYPGNEQVRGPKGGRFMTCHVAPAAQTPDATRIVREIPFRGRRRLVTIEPLATMIAPYLGWRPAG